MYGPPPVETFGRRERRAGDRAFTFRLRRHGPVAFLLLLLCIVFLNWRRRCIVNDTKGWWYPRSRRQASPLSFVPLTITDRASHPTHKPAYPRRLIFGLQGVDVFAYPRHPFEPSYWNNPSSPSYMPLNTDSGAKGVCPHGESNTTRGFESYHLRRLCYCV
jgi:hypothetical protein